MIYYTLNQSTLTIFLRQILVFWYSQHFSLPYILWQGCFEMRTLQNVGHFLQWMYHHVGYNDKWNIVSTFRTFCSGPYPHLIFRTVGPYVAASLASARRDHLRPWRNNFRLGAVIQLHWGLAAFCWPQHGEQNAKSESVAPNYPQQQLASGSAAIVGNSSWPWCELLLWGALHHG